MIEKLHPDCPRLFQRAKRPTNKDDEVWFTNAPIGKNALAKMMNRLSEKASLSRTYTNHSVRATAITRLSASGVEDRHIMAVSGHRSAQSLANYSAPTSSQKAAMAAVLDSDPAAPTMSLSDHPPAAPTTSLSDNPLQSLSSTDELDTFLTQASEAQIDEFEGGKPQSGVTDLPTISFPGATFQGCAITFNVTLNK